MSFGSDCERGAARRAPRAGTEKSRNGPRRRENWCENWTSPEWTATVPPLSPCRQAQAKLRIPGNGNAGHRNLPVFARGLVVGKVRPPRPVNRDQMTTVRKLAGDNTEGHRHPVDLGGKCLGNDREFHRRRYLRIPMCTRHVPIMFRSCYDLDKSELG